MVKSGAAGYASDRYAQAMAVGAQVMPLPNCRGHLILQPVPGGGRSDATGCYPLFSCVEPSKILEDLQAMSSAAVTLRLVPDPLLEFPLQAMSAYFSVVRPLGDHYLIRLADVAPSKHHRRKLRQAGRQPLDIRIERACLGFLEHWLPLYAQLIRRASISGARRFSPDIFAGMLQVPGGEIVTAWDGAELLGADWYYQDGERVYAHLSAYSARGYERSVSYPMMAAAIEHFRSKARVLNLGGVPAVGGREQSDGGGIAYFKRGWATEARPSYFFGLVLDMQAYLQLSGGARPSTDAFFPSYRAQEYERPGPNT